MNKTKLKQIIKEEMRKYLNERSFPDDHGKATNAADQIGHPMTSDENKVHHFQNMMNIIKAWNPEEQAEVNQCIQLPRTRKSTQGDNEVCLDTCRKGETGWQMGRA